MQVWNVLTGSLQIQDAKNRHLHTIAELCRAISSQLRHVSTIGKKLLISNISSTCFHSMVSFGPLAAEIISLVWGTPGNFNGFRVLAALRHGTPVLGVSQTLRHWTEGATYIRQGSHDVGHWPTFLVVFSFFITLFCLAPCGRLSWLFDSFGAHINIAHRIVSYRVVFVTDWPCLYLKNGR